jgi:hypothetical protein
MSIKHTNHCVGNHVAATVQQVHSAQLHSLGLFDPVINAMEYSTCIQSLMIRPSSLYSASKVLVI